MRVAETAKGNGTDAANAAGYAILKRRLAREAKGDWDHYTGGKSDFVADILCRAKADRRQINEVTQY